jgi:hypothetical protein
MRVYEITLSREAQTLSMSEPRGGPEFKSVHSVWTDWQMPLPWTAGLRKNRPFVENLPKGSIRPFAALQDRACERAESARQRSSAEGFGCG